MRICRLHGEDLQNLHHTQEDRHVAVGVLANLIERFSQQQRKRRASRNKSKAVAIASGRRMDSAGGGAYEDRAQEVETVNRRRRVVDPGR